ncbi:MAG: hypothetical protein ACOYBJ_01055 [Patescibacteria group bacterium]
MFRPGCIIVDAGRPRSLEGSTYLTEHCLQLDGAIFTIPSRVKGAHLLKMGEAQSTFGYLPETMHLGLLGDTSYESPRDRLSLDCTNHIATGLHRFRFRIGGFRIGDEPLDPLAVPAHPRGPQAARQGATYPASTGTDALVSTLVHRTTDAPALPRRPLCAKYKLRRRALARLAAKYRIPSTKCLKSLYRLSRLKSAEPIELHLMFKLCNVLCIPITELKCLSVLGKFCIPIQFW